MEKQCANLEKYIEAKKLLEDNIKISEIANRLGLGRSIISNWKNRGSPSYERMIEGLPARIQHKILDENNVDNLEYLVSLNPNISEELRNKTYSYLLGLYLGDGNIGRIHNTKQLCITLDKKYNNLNNYTINAFNILFDRAPFITDRSTHQGKYKSNCIVISYCNCNLGIIFPHEGYGFKHDRLIELSEWQKQIIIPSEIIKGLIMSDGSYFLDKATNKFHYNFRNRSENITNITANYLEQLGVSYTKTYNVSRKIHTINIYTQSEVEKLHSLIGDKNNVR